MKSDQLDGQAWFKGYMNECCYLGCLLYRPNPDSRDFF